MSTPYKSIKLHQLINFSVEGHDKPLKDIDDLLRATGQITEVDLLNRCTEIRADLVIEHQDRTFLSTSSVDHLDNARKREKERRVCSFESLDDDTRMTAIVGTKILRGGNDMPFIEPLGNFTMRVTKIEHSQEWRTAKREDVTYYYLNINCNGTETELKVPSEQFSSDIGLRGVLDKISNLQYDKKEISSIRTIARSGEIAQVNDILELGWDSELKTYHCSNAAFDREGTIVSTREPGKNGHLINQKTINLDADADEAGHFLFSTILKLHNPAIILVAIALVMLSWIIEPLVARTKIRPCFVLKGETESGKTTIAKIANALDGEETAMGSCTSTPNAIQRLAHMLRCCILVLDDFKADMLSDIQQKGLLNFLQNAYDSMGRSRMTDAEDMNPRCLIIVTGEQSIKIAASHAGRIFEITVPHFSAVKNGLDAKEKSALYNRVKSYLHKLSSLKPLFAPVFIDSLDQIVDLIEIETEVLQRDLPQVTNASRIAAAGAHVIAAAKIMLDFAIEQGYISSEDAEENIRNVICLIRQSAFAQAAEVKSYSPAHVYLNMVLELVASERYMLPHIHIDDKGRKSAYPPDNNKTVIGYIDEKAKEIYLLPEVSANAVRKALSDATINISTKTVMTSLKEEKLLVGGKRSRITINGQYQNFWVLQMDLLRSGDSCSGSECEDKLLDSLFG